MKNEGQAEAAASELCCILRYFAVGAPMKFSKIMLLFSAVLLAGCVSSEEYKKMQEEKIAQEAAQDDKQCRSYGAERGSVGYINCRQNLFSLRQAKEQFQNQQAAQAYDDMGKLGAQLLSQTQSQPRTMMNCTTTKQGVFLNTNCY